MSHVNQPSDIQLNAQWPIQHAPVPFQGGWHDLLAVSRATCHGVRHGSPHAARRRRPRAALNPLASLSSSHGFPPSRSSICVLVLFIIRSPHHSEHNDSSASFKFRQSLGVAAGVAASSVILVKPKKINQRSKTGW